MVEEQILWLLKDANGKIFGPYEYEKLFQFIENGILGGEEQIAVYPDGDWQAISRDMQLNEKLLEQLEKQLEKPSDAEKEEILQKSEVFQEPSEEGIADESARDVGTYIQADEDWAEEPEEEKANTSSVSVSTRTIEVKQRGLDKKRFGRFLIVISLLAIVFLHLSEKGSSEKTSLIIEPRKTKEILESAQEQRSKLIQAINFYKFGEKENYISARDILVNAVEKNAKNTDALALLCLVYKELWSFSDKTSADKLVISSLVQRSTQVETFSAPAITCKSVQSYLLGDFAASKRFTQRVLEDDVNAVTFYFLLAEVHRSLEERSKAIQNYQQAYRFWPEWLLPRIREGQMRLQMGQVSEARKIWLQVLQSSRDNESAAILLAHTDLFQYQDMSSAKHFISAFRKTSSQAEPSIKARGFEVLASLAEQTSDDSAVDYAKQALQLDSRSRYARAILENLGDGEVISVKSTAEAYIASGDLLASQGRYADAQAEYKTAFDLDNSNSMAAFKAARALWNLDQQTEAIAWVKKAINVDPKNFDAAILLAEFYGKRFNFREASKQLLRAQKISPKDYRVYSTYADLEFLRRNYPSAIKNAESALKLYDADVDSLYVLVNAHLQLGNIREAHYASSKAVELEANNAESQTKYALTLSKFQSPTAGINYIKNLVHTYPSNLEYRMGLAKVYYENDKFSEALAVLQQIEKLVKDKKPLYLLMSQIYEGMNDYENSLKSLLSTAQQSPSDPKIYFKIGVLQYRAKKYQNALEQFLMTKQLNENYPTLYTRIGESYLKLGQYDKAMQAAQKEIRRNPKLADGYLLAGEIYLSNGHYSKAAGQFQRVIQINPNSAYLYIKIARAHRLAGNYDLAKSMLAVAGEKESGNAEIYKETGALLQDTGNTLEAISSYKKYLKLSPNAGDREEIKSIIRSLGG
tara:strand:+ start:2365 stop:5136 length:2772 start_codon:yes stop_codon:yes gene_type:complete